MTRRRIILFLSSFFTSLPHHPLILCTAPVTPLLPLQFCNNKRKETRKENLFSGKGKNSNNNKKTRVTTVATTGHIIFV